MKIERTEVLGAVAGGLFGIGDAYLLRAIGVSWEIGGSDATGVVAAWFGTSTALFGWLAARFWMLRTRAREDARVIREQSEALEASQRAAIQNEKLAAIGRLAAGIAHEVRNPLGVIRSSASMLQEGHAEGDDGYRACQFICEEIDRLDSLIASLLNFARPVDLRTREVALGGVVDRALALARPAADRHGVRIERQLGEAPALRADPDLVAQVLLDLVTNATESEAKRVVVRTVTEGGEARLEVADDGPGIPDDLRDRVFEPFFTTKATGTGLGLAMAARIVQAHGGEILVVPGRGAGPQGDGACFRVDLPHAQVAA